MRRILTIPIAVLGIVGMAFGTIINVPGGYSTIQAGINAATDGDTVLIADGTYQGAGNKNLDFGGREIVVMSSGGADNCIIDCQMSGRGFYFHSGETNAAKLRGIAIYNGSNAYSGGINITNSSPTIEYCVIKGCVSQNSYGGGIYVSHGNPEIINCTLCLNAAKYGGGMYATASNFHMNSCIVATNSASG